MRAKQVHTPTAQEMLISSEDCLLIILKIKGMFHKGNTTAATKAILFRAPNATVSARRPQADEAN